MSLPPAPLTVLPLVALPQSIVSVRAGSVTVVGVCVTPKLTTQRSAPRAEALLTPKRSP